MNKIFEENKPNEPGPWTRVLNSLLFFLYDTLFTIIHLVIGSIMLTMAWEHFIAPKIGNTFHFTKLFAFEILMLARMVHSWFELQLLSESSKRAFIYKFFLAIFYYSFVFGFCYTVYNLFER